MGETYVVIHFRWDDWGVMYAGSDRAKADEVYDKLPVGGREIQIWEDGIWKEDIT